MNVGITGIENLKRGTNILEISVPPQLEDTVSMPKGSRVSFINDVFGGEGLTPSSVILFSGDSGIGKTTVVLQWLDQMTKSARCVNSGRGVICLYNTQEESLYQVRKTTKRLAIADGFVAGQDRMLTDILAHCDELRKRNPKKQLVCVIDSLQAIDDGKYKDGGITSGTHQRVLEALVKYAKEHFVIFVCISHVSKGGDQAGKNTLKHIVDVALHFVFDREKKSATAGMRLMYTSKNRFGAARIVHVLDMLHDGIKSLGKQDDFAGGVDVDEE